ncbi:hypothetical protein [Mycobacterium leprae]
MMLDLAGYYGNDSAAVDPVRGSMSSNLLAALGDSPRRACINRNARRPA